MTALVRLAFGLIKVFLPPRVVVKFELDHVMPPPDTVEEEKASKEKTKRFLKRAPHHSR